MDLKSRISVLEELHTSLNKEIDRIERSKVFDDLELHEKKKKRLQVKDELATLRKKHFEETYETLDWDRE